MHLDVIGFGGLCGIMDKLQLQLHLLVVPSCIVALVFLIMDQRAVRHRGLK